MLEEKDTTTENENALVLQELDLGNFNVLPTERVVHIAEYLKYKDKLNLSSTSKSMRLFFFQDRIDSALSQKLLMIKLHDNNTLKLAETLKSERTFCCGKYVRPMIVFTAMTIFLLGLAYIPLKGVSLEAQKDFSVASGLSLLGLLFTCCVPVYFSAKTALHEENIRKAKETQEKLSEILVESSEPTEKTALLEKEDNNNTYGSSINSSYNKNNF